MSRRFYIGSFLMHTTSREDPATGNGAAFFGHTCWNIGCSRADLSLRIEQGYKVRRPSLVMLRARMADGLREVSVGGHVTLRCREN